MDHTYFKLAHMLASVVFLGNIITELAWMRNAIKRQDIGILSFTVAGIIKGDKYFTIPSVVLITSSGVASSVSGHFSTLGNGWILYSIVLFVASGIIFSLRLVPLQNKICALAGNKSVFVKSDWVEINKLYRNWNFWGIVALITPLLAFIMMTLKIPR
ncbi:DUF2269 family protein [Parapedobacter deserti]|uniref:DUF2269 family protein n=1 Tax=Parapedobacter deserti TaxID=1912957 RepID=A0ABV7JNB9_9SPHI